MSAVSRVLPAVLFAAALAGSASPVLADAATGKQKAQMCAACHGIEGIAKTPDAPNIGGESAFYLDRQLRAFRSGERHHEQMNMIAGSLSDEDIADLVAWYSSLKVSVEMPAE